MAKYFKISVGAIWLTSDGSESGNPCKTEVPAADQLLAVNPGNVTFAANGLPFRESPLASGAGKTFELLIGTMTADVFDAVKTLLDQAATENLEINITGTGTPGSFDVDAIVFDNPTYLSFNRFSTGYVKNVVMRFVTTSVN